LVHIGGEVPDRADVRWEQRRITVTLSRMAAPAGSRKMGLGYRCVEVQLSRDASGLILIDGATGERADAKRSRYLDPEYLRQSERTLDDVFEPRQFLTPTDFTPTGVA
jgi:hypothetical protein